MQLAIDTATHSASVVLAKEGVAQAHLSWRSQYNHTAQLIPAIEALQRHQGLAPKDLSAVCVSLGPGSFSALKVGLSVAKTLAYTLDIPLVGVGTLECEALPFIYAGTPICPILELGRQDIAAALLTWHDGAFHPMRSEYLTTPEKLASDLADASGSILCCGEGLPKAASILKEKLGSRVTLAEPTLLQGRALALAYLGYLRLSRGQRDDPATLQPLYLRAPSITTPKPIA